MFNIGPSMGMMKQFPQLMQRRGSMGGPMSGMLPMGGGGGGEMMPPPDMGDMGGGMPTIDVGMGAKFPGMMGGGGPRMPGIIDGPMPTFPGGGGQNPGPMKPPMQGGGPFRKPMPMGDRMSQNRPGFWGKYNTIAQGLQGPAMDMLLGNRQQRGY